MGWFNCFSGLLSGKKKAKDSGNSVARKGHGASQLSLSVFIGRSSGELKENISDKVVPVRSDQSGPLQEKKHTGDDLDGLELLRPHVLMLEVAYEGGDEHDEKLPMTRDCSDSDLQAILEFNEGTNLHNLEEDFVLTDLNDCEETGIATDTMMTSGHLSDPGVRRSTAFCGSPKLKRSCSNIERTAAKSLLYPTKSLSHEDLKILPEYRNRMSTLSFGIHSSPLSVLSSCSADRVLLKKQSSCQVLPSRSRKLWWKLFLWSHRNSHKTCEGRPTMVVSSKKNPKNNSGYSSDTVEPIIASKGCNSKGGETSASIAHSGHQWVAFSAEVSPLDRVNAWVNTLECNPMDSVEDGEYCDDDDDDTLQTQGFCLKSSLEVGESSRKNRTQNGKQLQDDILQANNIVHSLNPLSAVAHISGMGLKIIPLISAFSSLKAVNLSGNLIVHITPGVLPKSLHTLDLSRNKITAIEGLRELTRLRVLNLSCNKISRIGHGLSNCIIIKELYLAGNKITHIEGLHRLLKLGVLDLSFNKITTMKTLGQLVANYHSLQALNLLGNPIQINIGDDQLRRAVSGLLTHLVYLNKQPLKPQNAREVITDSIARAALGNGWSSRRRVKKINQGSGSKTSRGGSGSSKHRPNGNHRHHSSTKSRNAN